MALSQCSQGDKLPDTCPTVCSQKSQHISQSSSVIWGYLFANKPEIRWAALSSSEYLVGRSPKSNIILGEEIDPNLRCQFSKEHFRIRRAALNGSNDLKVVHLDDLSFNGTFINGKKLGKGRSAVLRNNDKISLALPKYEAFIYMDGEVDPEVKWFPADVLSKYAISRKLGCGAYGEVRLAFDKNSGEGFAMKVIQKNKFIMTERKASYQPIRVQREINILKRLRHSFVIKFHDVMDHPDVVFLVVELVHGGELFNKVQKGALRESNAKYYFYQLALAIKYLHRQGIIHRDIKLENILLTEDPDNPMIKLADFGLSNFVDSESMLKTYCGTPMYIAPEVLRSEGRNGSYDTQADVWSMGIVLYMCLSGLSPFAVGDPNLPLSKQILTGYYSFPRQHWRRVSHNAIHLVKKMLVVDPRRRINIDQILEHPWLMDKALKTRVSGLLRKDVDWQLAGKENVIQEENEDEDEEEEEEEERDDEFVQPRTKKVKLDNEDTSSVNSRTDMNG